MPRAPLITVVVPAYNLARFLPETLESALQQELSSGDLDVMVVDDGSADDTPDVLAGFRDRIRSVRQINRGLPAARNRGASETTARYLTFLDADDRLLPGKLAAEIAVLEAEPSATIAYSGWHYIDEAGQRLPQHGWSRDEGDVLPRLLLGNIVHPHAATVRREAFEAVGGFDERLTSVEDWDLWLRLSLHGARWRHVDRAALEYRVRGDGMHANPARMLSNRIMVLDNTFDRLARLGSHLEGMRDAAYANVHLEAAADWARAGDLDAASAAIRSALAHESTILSDPAALRGFCRLLLPLGYRNDGILIDEWPRLRPLVGRLVRDVTRHDRLLDRLVARATIGRVSSRYWRKRGWGLR